MILLRVVSALVLLVLTDYVAETRSRRYMDDYGYGLTRADPRSVTLFGITPQLTPAVSTVPVKPVVEVVEKPVYIPYPERPPSYPHYPNPPHYPSPPQPYPYPIPIPYPYPQYPNGHGHGGGHGGGHGHWDNGGDYNHNHHHHHSHNYNGNNNGNANTNTNSNFNFNSNTNNNQNTNLNSNQNSNFNFNENENFNYWFPRPRPPFFPFPFFPFFGGGFRGGFGRDNFAGGFPPILFVQPGRRDAITTTRDEDYDDEPEEMDEDYVDETARNAMSKTDNILSMQPSELMAEPEAMGRSNIMPNIDPARYPVAPELIQAPQKMTNAAMMQANAAYYPPIPTYNMMYGGYPQRKQLRESVNLVYLRNVDNYRK